MFPGMWHSQPAASLQSQSLPCRPTQALRCPSVPKVLTQQTPVRTEVKEMGVKGSGKCVLVTFRNSAAVMAPPFLGPQLVRSAIVDLVCSFISSVNRGMRQIFSELRPEDWAKSPASSSSELHRPAHLYNVDRVVRQCDSN